MSQPTQTAIACAVCIYLSFEFPEGSHEVKECNALYNAMVDQVQQDPSMLAVSFDLAHGASVGSVWDMLDGSDFLVLLEAAASLIDTLMVPRRSV